MDLEVAHVASCDGNEASKNGGGGVVGMTFDLGCHLEELIRGRLGARCPQGRRGGGHGDGRAGTQAPAPRDVVADLEAKRPARDQSNGAADEIVRPRLGDRAVLGDRPGVGDVGDHGAAQPESHRQHVESGAEVA